MADHSNQPGGEILAKTAANISLAMLENRLTVTFALSHVPTPRDTALARARAQKIGWQLRRRGAQVTLTMISTSNH